MNLKAGDLVILQGRSLGSPDKSLQKVDRITTCFIIVNGLKFRKTDGYMTGNGWNFKRIMISSDEEIAAIKGSWRRYDLTCVNWSKIDQQKIDLIHEILTPSPSKP